MCSVIRVTTIHKEEKFARGLPNYSGSQNSPWDVQLPLSENLKNLIPVAEKTMLGTLSVLLCLSPQTSTFGKESNPRPNRS